jgi:hypothetical protein
LRSPVQMAADRPYSESLANRIASSASAKVGGVEVQGINWDTSTNPQHAAAKLADQVRAWLSQL